MKKKLSINQYNLVKVEKKSGCTTEGCNGEGNINASYKKHYSAKNCTKNLQSKVKKTFRVKFKKLNFILK